MLFVEEIYVDVLHQVGLVIYKIVLITLLLMIYNTLYYW